MYATYLIPSSYSLEGVVTCHQRVDRMANSELRLGLIDEHFDSGAAADFRLKGPLQLIEYVQVVFAIDAEGLVQWQRLQIVVCETGKFNNKIPEILLVLLLGKVLAVCTVRAIP